MQGQIAMPHKALCASRRFTFGWLIAGCAAAFILGVLIGPAVTKYFKPAISSMPRSVVRASIGLEPGHWLDGWRWGPPFGLDHPTRTAMAISRDGLFVIYSAVKANPGPQDKPLLYLRRFDRREAKPISGTEGAECPFLSPDDRWVGFWAEGKLSKVSVEGGVPLPLCDLAMPFGASWASDKGSYLRTLQTLASSGFRLKAEVQNH